MWRSPRGWRGWPRMERENRDGRGRRSSPLCIPHLAPRRTGANVKRFRDVKTDTRVAHLGPTTSNGNAGTHVWLRCSAIRHPRSQGITVSVDHASSRQSRSKHFQRGHVLTSRSGFSSRSSLNRASRIVRDTCFAR